MEESTLSHAALMDATYRYQRLFYDATRRYYLLGRDRLIRTLDPPARAHILEVACGTGRNLDRIAARYPGRGLYGLDISEQMLRSARAKLAGRAVLARADARDFDPGALFGRCQFDRIVFSYSLSMIPDWEESLRHALPYLAPGGELHIVDFGGQRRLPAWFGAGLRAWLARFHVAPRDDLAEAAARIAAEADCRAISESLFRDYCQHLVIRRPGPAD
ncbi:O-methyltransferase [Defluviimonas sp. 20V17]|uniref:O-methyltransferase n=2 Tax=Allgaiera indica TaxID=765699 RepID=A0AAN5A138_9RHOB|nr:class I SAM-dependent methyltransferase [Allgaiera indica]KDB05031.1 O-methyltransferase [Defluviimonas sp. 20V17]GHE05498.1 O-methyltransferase [Allgaiera indica]